MNDDDAPDEFGLTIELTGNVEPGHLYVERGQVEGGTAYYADDADPPKVRDLFPQRPTAREAIAYPKPEALAPRPQPRRSFLRGEIAKARRWWRAHWWPARIRDLEAELRDANADLWGE